MNNNGGVVNNSCNKFNSDSSGLTNKPFGYNNNPIESQSAAPNSYEKQYVQPTNQGGKNGFELRWTILEKMIDVVKDEWFTKREVAEFNAKKSKKPLEYIGDIPLHDALQRAENVYQSFVCKKY